MIQDMLLVCVCGKIALQLGITSVRPPRERVMYVVWRFGDINLAMKKDAMSVKEQQQQKKEQLQS